MPIQVQVRGLKELNKFFVRLGPNLNKEIPKVTNLFMKETQKSARIRAPKFTGQLSRSIRVFKKGNKTIILRLSFLELIHLMVIFKNLALLQNFFLQIYLLKVDIE